MKIRAEIIAKNQDNIKDDNEEYRINLGSQVEKTKN